MTLPQVGHDICSIWEVEGAEVDEVEHVRCNLEGSKLLGMLSSDNDIFWTRELIGLVGGRLTSATPTVASSANMSTSAEVSALLKVVSDLLEKKLLRVALAGLVVAVLGCEGEDGK